MKIRMANGMLEEHMSIDKLRGMGDSIVKLAGFVHKIRRMSGFAFIILRTERDLIQCVYSDGEFDFDVDNLLEESCVEICGKVVLDNRSATGFEIHITEINILSIPHELVPVTINKKDIGVSLDVNLVNRPISLRNPKQRAIFKLSEGIGRAFRDFLLSHDFTEIRTPKIVSAGAEGGANIFKFDYFGQPAYLAQSPQFYKQSLVGVFGKVFEVAPVYRAEKHNTSRHLNEYTSMDLEMGFIDSFYDIINLETALLRYIFDFLNQEYKKEIDLLKIQLPVIQEIPVMKFMDAKNTIQNELGRKVNDFHDFEPEEEVLMCNYSEKKFNSEFIFITHYPSEKRPFYTMDDKNNPGHTLSFDLLYRGLEITTGGQRIHDYVEQVEKMKKRNMNIDDFESYLMIHKHGMPPHGGLGMGLERIAMKLLGLSNIRESCLFPRDMTRVKP